MKSRQVAALTLAGALALSASIIAAAPRAAAPQIARERDKQARTRSSPAPAVAGARATAPDRDPYANAAAPYKADRLASRKLSILNTPGTVTVLTKEILKDKNATTLKEIGRSTAGVTLGTGE